MTDRMMQFFECISIPQQDMRALSKPFEDMAKFIVDTFPSNPERTVCLRKLLEAKDCAMRATTYREPV